MAYTPVIWDDLATPVDEIHLNQMDQGIVGLDTGKVDKDSVVVAASRIVASKLLAADAQPAFRVLGDGKHEWGAGGATAIDTNLYRSGANQLKTDDALRVVGDFIVNQGSVAGQVWVNSAGSMYFGTALDTRLYRAAAANLKVDGSLTVRDSLVAETGRLYFGTALDTNLYRSAAYTLRVAEILEVSQQAVIGASGSNAFLTLKTDNAAIWFGAAPDTNLYRTAYGTLRTPGFRIDNYLDVDFLGTGAQLRFGSAVDTNLYRATAGVLKTDGALQAASYVGGAVNLTGETLIGALGPAGQPAVLFHSDTNLYRSAATALRTDGSLIVTNTLNAHWSGVWAIETLASPGPGLKFGGDVVANLYRSAAGVLKTDGSLNVAGLVSTAHVQANAGNAANQIYLAGDGKIYFSTANDTSLYRQGAAQLATGGEFWVKGAPASLTYSGLVANFNTVGDRRFTVGPPDSAGAGFRAVKVDN